MTTPTKTTRYAVTEKRYLENPGSVRLTQLRQTTDRIGVKVGVRGLS